MLSTPVGIFTPSSLGGGEYQFQLFFQVTSNAKFLAIGDTVKDSTGNEYQVTTWATSPVDFASGGTVDASFITSDIIPQVDTGFDSAAFTPGQVDTRPEMQTPGTIFNISLTSGQAFEYELNAAWSIGSQSNQAVVGDRIVDNAGKEYEISQLDGGLLFTTTFKMTEVEGVGVAPATGAATLYRSTPNFEFFQGSELTDPSRTVIFNRDKFLIDNLLSLGGGGGATFNTEEHTISSGEASAKSFTLENPPTTPSKVLADVVEGVPQKNGTDFSISGSSFNWTGLGLDGKLVSGDVVRLIYLS